MPAVGERQAAARLLWHDLLRQAERDNRIMRSDVDYADKFREFGKFFLWLCLHSYKPGMTLIRKNPCDPFYPRNCVLKSAVIQGYDPIAEKLQGHRTVSGTVAADSRLYEIWRGVKKRCLNPKCKDYPDYGGRGIRGKTYRNIRLTVKRMRDFLQNMPGNSVVTLIARRDCLPDFNGQEDDYPAIPESERIDARRNHG